MSDAIVVAHVRYYVTLHPGLSPSRPTRTVDLVERADGSMRAQCDGHAVELDVVALGNRLSVRVDGLVVDLATEGDPGAIEAFLRGRRVEARVESDRTRATDRRPGEPRAAAPRTVRSPMPGRVVKVLVKEGDSLRPGQGLVVLEAMKMENEVRAASAGVVSRVHVEPGVAVDRDAPLVTLA